MRMRRALGLGDQPSVLPGDEQPDIPASPRALERSSSGPAKRRFVQDGQVPVVVVRRDATNEPALVGRAARADASLRARLSECQTALADAHRAVERLDRDHKQAQETIHDLRTKLGHADLRRRELEAQRQADVATLTELRQQLDIALARQLPEPPARVAKDDAAHTAPAPRKVGRPRRDAAPKPAKEPQPVKWWIKPRSRKS